MLYTEELRPHPGFYTLTHEPRLLWDNCGMSFRSSARMHYDVIACTQEVPKSRNRINCWESCVLENYLRGTPVEYS